MGGGIPCFLNQCTHEQRNERDHKVSSSWMLTSKYQDSHTLAGAILCHFRMSFKILAY